MPRRPAGAAFGDSQRARIQAHAFRAATYGSLGLAVIVAPFHDNIQEVLASDALGGLMVLYAVLIVFGALTPSAMRSRLEGEADQRIAATR